MFSKKRLFTKVATSVKENYLKALYTLSDESGKVNITDLSKHLHVTKPTANHMIKSLEELGWVKHERYKPVVLTALGRKAAALIIRKHRLTEMFLHEVMGFGWEEVHEVAEQMEHIDSPLLFERMDEMLDYPKVDPHGSPIPDREGHVQELSYIALSEMKAGDHGTVSALRYSSQHLLHYLNQSSIELGTKIELLRVEPFDGSRMIRYNGDQEKMVSEKVASSLLLSMD